MKKSKKEVSDKVIVGLLIVAVFVSVLGAYMIYDYSHSYEMSDAKYLDVEDKSIGMVALNVVDIDDTDEEFYDEGIE
ncbi:hypothetical protein HOG16_01100 [Candidatus Woesearchaeota archaeon]|nr:hypothetical protein [Candidatus Woesearchaeota archaeon]MBT4322170.1 hypothetical protein [Candidatus Woesearchaeota archaeon]MBT4630918.1 hypothetical protein [Candidatus Woesearchaeota archaeon]